MTEIVAGIVTQLSPLLRRITAPNPSPLTASGTNTYLLGVGEVVVVDPGPNIPLHIDEILKACNGKLSTVFVTHTHADHSPAAAVLAKETGAVLKGATLHNDGQQDVTFQVEQQIAHGELFKTKEFTLEAVYTPGHVGNHFCYFLQDENVLFTGDHIMEGSTVVIVPPSGDMAEYVDSLRLLKNYPITSLAPGHGTLVENPDEWINYLIDHRLMREQKVIAGLQSCGEVSLKDLTDVVYDDVDKSLLPIASVSLWAHLLKLEQEGKVAKFSEKHWMFGEERWELL